MATLKVEFTQSLVDRLEFDKQPKLRAGKLCWHATPADTHDWFIQDTQTSGLLIRLTPTAATWVVRRKLNGRTVVRAMGSVRTGEAGQFLTLSQARNLCEQWRGMMARGFDPLLERKKVGTATALEQAKQQVTMRRAFHDYIEAKRENSAEATTKDREKVARWLEQSPVWSCPVAEVNREMVTATFQPLLDLAKGRQVKHPRWGPARPGSVNKMYIYAHQAWKREALRQHIVGDPFKEWRQDVKWPQAKIKTRRLDTSSEDGKRWIQALVQTWKSSHEREAEAPMASLLADYYLCVLLWGTRLTETCKVEWGHVDERRGVVWLVPENTKTKRLGAVPITQWVDEILQRRKDANEYWRPGPWVFPSPVHGQPLSNPRKALVRLAEETGVMVSTHDLRRTLASDLGVETNMAQAQAITLAGAALQHARGSGVTEDYMLSRAEILRPIYQRREDHIREIAGLKPLGEQPAESNDDLIDRIVEDPAMRKRLLTKLLATDK